MLVPPRSGAENMARDAGLIERARDTGEAVFSVYSWVRPTLSFGRNQTACGLYDIDALATRGIDVVRRPTGGRALLHWHEVTYSVTAPANDSLGEWYQRINRILLRGLALLGVSASESAGDGAALPPGPVPCFAAPAKGELVVNGAKLVGSAQYREKGALLQHGSILLRDDQALIDSLMKPSDTPWQPTVAATITEAIGREPSVGEVASLLFASLRELEDVEARALDEAEVASRTALHLDEYKNELWTWRR